MTKPTRGSEFSVDKREEFKRQINDRQSLILQKKLQDISIVKKEKKLMAKRKLQLDKANLRRNQERRLEIQFQITGAQERIKRQKMKKIEEKIKLKEVEMMEE